MYPRTRETLVAYTFVKTQTSTLKTITLNANTEIENAASCVSVMANPSDRSWGATPLPVPIAVLVSVETCVCVEDSPTVECGTDDN